MADAAYGPWPLVILNTALFALLPAAGSKRGKRSGGLLRRNLVGLRRPHRGVHSTPGKQGTS